MINWWANVLDRTRINGCTRFNLNILRHKATEIANEVLKSSGNEGEAIATGLKRAREHFDAHPEKRPITLEQVMMENFRYNRLSVIKVDRFSKWEALLQNVKKRRTRFCKNS